MSQKRQAEESDGPRRGASAQPGGSSSSLPHRPDETKRQRVPSLRDVITEVMWSVTIEKLIQPHVTRVVKEEIESAAIRRSGAAPQPAAKQPPAPNQPALDQHAEQRLSIRESCHYDGKEMRKKMAGESSNHTNPERLLLNIIAGKAEPQELPFQFLKDIANNFSDDRKIGEGAFGVVYKGIFNNGKNTVVVKKLKHSLPEVMDRQFEREVHALRLNHKNIVRFLGFCIETWRETVAYNGTYISACMKEMLICMEYIPNGSLKEYIKGASHGLNWNERYKIIKGLCFGLHFLHEETQTNTSIIHGDLKPANILLTKDMVPKIADFGLSRLFGKDFSRIYTEDKRGTPGYMAREFWDRGKITDKLDIFSLGVIVLEIITGDRDYPWSDGSLSVEDYVEIEVNKWRKRLQDSSSRRSLENDCRQIKKCIEIGLKCVKSDYLKRPTAKEIIESLNTLDSTNVPVNNSPPRHSSNQSSGQRICAGCNTWIGNEGILMAMGSDWHHRCFKCSHCNKPISHSSNFFQKENQPYHESCYKERFNLNCANLQ